MPGSRPDPSRAGFDAGTVIDVARTALELSRLDLWVAYVAMGGGRSPAEIRSFLCGETTVTTFDYDMLAQALNEQFEERGVAGPIPYSDAFHPVLVDRRP